MPRPKKPNIKHEGTTMYNLSFALPRCVLFHVIWCHSERSVIVPMCSLNGRMSVYIQEARQIDAASRSLERFLGAVFEYDRFYVIMVVFPFASIVFASISSLVIVDDLGWRLGVTLILLLIAAVYRLLVAQMAPYLHKFTNVMTCTLPKETIVQSQRLDLRCQGSPISPCWTNISCFAGYFFL